MNKYSRFLIAGILQSIPSAGFRLKMQIISSKY